jgi:hypothetical protein
MPNEIQSVRYDLPMQAPRGFMSYAADAAQAYYKKKKEVEDAKRADVMAAFPTLAANNMLRPAQPGEKSVNVLGMDWTSQVKPQDYGNLENQAQWEVLTGQRDPSPIEIAKIAATMERDKSWADVKYKPTAKTYEDTVQAIRDAMKAEKQTRTGYVATGKVKKATKSIAGKPLTRSLKAGGTAYLAEDGQYYAEDAF